MNIYIHVEILSREIDSKILLAILAADKGHEVLISDLETITKGLQRNKLVPGIFHTKSLTPSDEKIKTHQSLIDKGSKITSIDEEAGLVDFGYEKFAKDRYSNTTLKQASAIFGWGPEDSNTLKKIYPDYSSKIFMTGSPRVDLWKPFFSSYWGQSKNSNKPYLLIPSNTTGIINYKSFHKLIKNYKKLGYAKRDPNIIKYLFDTTGEDIKIIYSFLEAIKLLSKSNEGYDIILRPHPTESLEAWKILLEDFENVKVIREDSISKWVNNAFAILHNCCTTALEAYINGKPIITYEPFERVHFGNLPNQIGKKVKTPSEVLNAVNWIFNNSKLISSKKPEIKISEIMKNKIYINTEHAGNKIVNLWEKLNDKNFSKKNNWYKFKLNLKIMKFNGFLGRIYKNMLKGNLEVENRNFKFPTLNEKDIKNRVTKLINLLGVRKDIQCHVLSERSILIK